MKRSDITTLDVLKSAKLAYTERKGMTWQHIGIRTGAPSKVIYAAMEREYDKGYLECGVSIRTAWLTEKGEEKLRELEEAKNGKTKGK